MCPWCCILQPKQKTWKKNDFVASSVFNTVEHLPAWWSITRLFFLTLQDSHLPFLSAYSHPCCYLLSLEAKFSFFSPTDFCHLCHISSEFFFSHPFFNARRSNTNGLERFQCLMHRNWLKISTTLLHTHSGNFSLSFLQVGMSYALQKKIRLIVQPYSGASELPALRT